MSQSSNLVSVGRITAVYGIKGWVKVHSYTEVAEDLFGFTPWWLKTQHGVKKVEIDEYRSHGNSFVAHIRGIDDRDIAATFTGFDIAVERDLLPGLDEGEYYWSQLEGLSVISEYEGQQYRFGKVARLLETGANDVLVVVPDVDSFDKRERLIPYVPDQFVLSVDLNGRTLTVAWDPEF